MFSNLEKNIKKSFLDKKTYKIYGRETPQSDYQFILRDLKEKAKHLLKKALVSKQWVDDFDEKFSVIKAAADPRILKILNKHFDKLSEIIEEARAARDIQLRLRARFKPDTTTKGYRETKEVIDNLVKITTENYNRITKKIDLIAEHKAYPSLFEDEGQYIFKAFERGMKNYEKKFSPKKKPRATKKHYTTLARKGKDLVIAYFKEYKNLPTKDKDVTKAYLVMKTILVDPKINKGRIVGSYYPIELFITKKIFRPKGLSEGVIYKDKKDLKMILPFICYESGIDLFSVIDNIKGKIGKLKKERKLSIIGKKGVVHKNTPGSNVIQVKFTKRFVEKYVNRKGGEEAASLLGELRLLEKRLDYYSDIRFQIEEIRRFINIWNNKVKNVQNEFDNKRKNFIESKKEELGLNNDNLNRENRNRIEKELNKSIKKFDQEETEKLEQKVRDASSEIFNLIEDMKEKERTSDISNTDFNLGKMIGTLSYKIKSLNEALLLLSGQAYKKSDISKIKDDEIKAVIEEKNNEKENEVKNHQKYISNKREIKRKQLISKGIKGNELENQLYKYINNLPETDKHYKRIDEIDKKAKTKIIDIRAKYREKIGELSNEIKSDIIEKINENKLRKRSVQEKLKMPGGVSLNKQLAIDLFKDIKNIAGFPVGKEDGISTKSRLAKYTSGMIKSEASYDKESETFYLKFIINPIDPKTYHKVKEKTPMDKPDKSDDIGKGSQIDIERLASEFGKTFSPEDE